MSRTHWLYRPETIPRLWIGGAVLLALTVFWEAFVSLHAHFGFADWFGFSAVYGFLSCVAMVLFAKGLGRVIKRADDYYEAGAAGDAGEQDR